MKPMAKQNLKSTERKVDEIIITNKVLRLGRLVIPIKNVIQIEVYKISKKSGSRFLLSLIIGILVFFLVLVSNFFYPINEVLSLIIGGIFMVLSFILLKIKQKRLYALRIQSSTGQEDYITARDESFLEELVEEINYAMENSEQALQVIANIKNKTINKNENIMGDKISASESSNIIKNTGDGNVTGVGSFSAEDGGNINFGKIIDSFNGTPNNNSNQPNTTNPQEVIFKKDLLSMLANNKTDTVLERLLHYFQNQKHKEATKAMVVLTSKSNQINMEENLGVTEHSEIKLNRARITSALLNIIEKEI
jgi:hypothetical protein